MKTDYVDRAKAVLLERKGFVRRRETWLSLYEGKPEAFVSMTYFCGFTTGASSIPVDMTDFYNQMIGFGISAPVADTTFLRYTRKSDTPLNDPKEAVKVLEEFLSQQNRE